MGIRSLALSAVGIILAGSPETAGPWTLPQGTAVKDAGPRTYRFTMDYTASDIRGAITHRQRVAATYTRGLPGGDVVWNDVTVAEADGPTAPLGAPQKPAFMQGLRYRKGPKVMDEMMQPEFFKNAPPTAVVERNLVWDLEALEWFGQGHFEQLKLNESHRLLSDQTVDMKGIGTFQNRDLQLTWTGRSRRNGHDCAVIDYRAYYNPLAIANGGMTLTGRSHYWGQVWVALETKQVEYATLYEDVLGEMKLAGQDAPQIIDVFRSGVLEPVAQR
jgi:hypothetical protein